MKKILVIGSLNMDIAVGVDNMPLIGETILGNSLKYVPGGKGANQSFTAAMLKSDTAMLGCIGKDDFGSILKANLERAGVNVERLNLSSNNPTGTAVIYIDKKGSNSIVVVPGANKDCNVEYLKANDDLFQECDFILLQMEIPYDAVYYAIKRGSELGKVIILNPAPAPENIPEEVLKKIDYLTPNETELAKISGLSCNTIEEIRTASLAMIEKGVKNVLVTMGEKGAMMVDKKSCKIYPARKVDAVDTTAAGDCFNASFIVGLAENNTIEEAIHFANIASSIAVTRQGAQSSIPTRIEVENILCKVNKD